VKVQLSLSEAFNLSEGKAERIYRTFSDLLMHEFHLHVADGKLIEKSSDSEQITLLCLRASSFWR
jgi:hypothetical protein